MGKNKKITQFDIQKLSKEFNATHLLTQFQMSWNEQLLQTPNNPSLLKALISVLDPCKYFIFFIACIIYWLSIVLIIIFIQNILIFIQNQESYIIDIIDITQQDAYLYCAGIGILLFYITIHDNLYWFKNSMNDGLNYLNILVLLNIF